MMPLERITIPVGYLLPDFQGDLEQKEDNKVDIFQFGTQSVEKIIQRSKISHSGLSREYCAYIELREVSC